MKRGVVLELCDGSAVVLDTGGSFCRIPARPSWQVGDVVPLSQHTMRPFFALVACLAVVFFSGGAMLWFTQTGLVSLDVNPSVELRLNRFDRVISAHALNQEGETLLARTTVRGLDCGAAVSTLLTQGQDYSQDSLVTLTVQAGTPRQEAVLLALTERSTGTLAAVECHGVSQALVDEAHIHGVTAGKYLALLALQAADPLLDISDYTHCGIGEIKEETQRCLENGHNNGESNPAQGNGFGGKGYRDGNGHHGNTHHSSHMP